MRFRKRAPRLVASFDELMERAYGAPDARALRPASSAERLMDRYYGHEKRRHNKCCGPGHKLHVHCDESGHTLHQPRRNGITPAASPRALPPPAAARERLPPAPAVSPPMRTTPPAPPDVPSFTSVAPAPAPEPPPLLPVAPQPPAPELQLQPPPPPMAAAPAAPSAANPPFDAAKASSMLSRHETSTENTTASDDDFIADMKSILDGTGAYDKDRKKVIPKSTLRERERAEADAASHHGVGEGGEEGQRIFDKIAKSMRYAGAYDLGEVELENRFADFDRMDDLKARPRKPARKSTRSARRPEAAPAPAPTGIPMVDNKDFIEDLEAIQKNSVETAEGMRDASIDIANAMKPKLSNPESVPGSYSKPFYGTGEHARTAGNLYQDQILVGKAPGVLFSYGDLVTMGDFFDNVKQLQDEDAGLLGSLKALIRKEVAGGSVDTKAWMAATRDRYLRLAEDNYEHFAPNLFFTSKKFTRSLQHRNHKEAWEAHHKKAIEAARANPVDVSKISSSQKAAEPLVINAFGDHFLTDAFAAGHIINKQEIAELFKSRFYSGGKLNADGAAFFDKVAKEAWRGKVAQKFSQLETFEPYDAWWNVVAWNPNINSAERFASVLKGVGEKAPDKIANLAVKAIHDHFNKLGIEVTNAAGNGPWKLTGDGYLTEQTRAIIETAVRESAGHLIDPAVLAGSPPFTELYARVWKHVPQLTPASATTLTNFVNGYIAPGHPVLVTKAADLINDEIDTLIQQLLDAKALKPA